MIKFLFFDYRDYEYVRGATRRLERPRKHRDTPFLVSDKPWEGNSMTMYGSVLRRPDDGLFQMWYSLVNENGISLAYAESDDGIEWRRVLGDKHPYEDKPTNIVMDASPHGATVMYDEREDRPGWKYKLLCGAKPSHRISAFRSPDGINWFSLPKNPVMGSNPDSPMSLHRADDGRYVAYHRAWFGDRRVGRSESWDFLHWTEPKIVMEPDAGDPAQMQFYGMGTIPYGAYELGTLWIYRTEEDDLDFYKMKGHQEPELAYCRSGYAWHRASQGNTFIPRGKKGTWDWGMLQCASSPVFLEDEIRFYYAGFRVTHPWGKSSKKIRNRCGIGMASTKPDRFVRLESDEGRASILTRPFWTDCPEFYVNAAIKTGGKIRLEITDLDGKVIPGFELKNCVPIAGDGLRLPVSWKNNPTLSKLVNTQIRIRLQGDEFRLYSVASGCLEETRDYSNFRVPYFLDMDREKALVGSQ